ncbi:uncharacterized protein LOC112513673 [Cynara cardunculus var. scolymus]|uniref:uncharacterized protein LOC112513673 n=1 Tax=Cynara cardunculus var. scolymus TaxID=59895 RepID=UPI000D62BA9C|nr:uncharacterized protein LOC112513673 [Cynara cardunculus var. scolymus]
MAGGGGKRRDETGCAGGDAKDDDKLIINQIMLRFRPIAPRPVSSVGCVPLKDGMVSMKRAKRKYVRVKKKKIGAAECNLTVNDDKRWMNLDKTVAMLKVCSGSEFVVTDPMEKVPDCISFDVNNIKIGSLITPAPPSLGLHEVDLAIPVKQGQVVESWITMESVTGTCEDGRRLRYTDDEILKDLEMDNCPGFTSNSYDEVEWVNLAYRRMVDPNPEGGSPPPEVLVWLGVKVEKSMVDCYWPAFSCRVRVVYQLSEIKKKQMTVPCDVWKMDSGGYAWRLDVKAALSLGR